MDGIFTPYFLQSACAHAASEIRILFVEQPSSLPIIISSKGELTVQYIAGGEKKEKTFGELHQDALTGVIPDARTFVTIKGNVTYLHIEGPAPLTATVGSCNLSKCSTIKNLYISGSEISNLELPNNDKSIINFDTSIGRVDFIKCKSDNQLVANVVAAAITNSSQSGDVFTNSDGAYYNTIAQAAITAGWTINNI